MKVDIYKRAPIPIDLTFDEESLFWRLRMGEGLPSRKWHKPLDRNKSWEEIKLSLDEKVDAVRKSCQGVVSRLAGRLVSILKRSFLLQD